MHLTANLYLFIACYKLRNKKVIECLKLVSFMVWQWNRVPNMVLRVHCKTRVLIQLLVHVSVNSICSLELTWNTEDWWTTAEWALLHEHNESPQNILGGDYHVAWGLKNFSKIFWNKNIDSLNISPQNSVNRVHVV